MGVYNLWYFVREIDVASERCNQSHRHHYPVACCALPYTPIAISMLFLCRAGRVRESKFKISTWSSVVR